MFFQEEFLYVNQQKLGVSVCVCICRHSFYHSPLFLPVRTRELRQSLLESLPCQAQLLLSCQSNSWGSVWVQGTERELLYVLGMRHSITLQLHLLERLMFIIAPVTCRSFLRFWLFTKLDLFFYEYGFCSLFLGQVQVLSHWCSLRSSPIKARKLHGPWASPSEPQINSTQWRKVGEIIEQKRVMWALPLAKTSLVVFMCIFFNRTDFSLAEFIPLLQLFQIKRKEKMKPLINI